MESVQDELDLLKTVLKGIAMQFGERCEVVLHDWSRPYDSTIVAIENGHVTGRKVGDPGTNFGLEILRGSSAGDDPHKYNYITQTKDGRMLRSTSMYIKNKSGQPIGAICINLDISDLMLAEQTIRSFTSPGSQQMKESFVSNVNDLLDILIQEVQEQIGKPVKFMDKSDKVLAIKLLDRKGAFLIKKAGEKISEHLNISKYTLYSYLEESKDG